MNVKKIGRPPLDPEVKRSEAIVLRLTRDEMDFVNELSLEQNKPKTQVCRELIFGEEGGDSEKK